MGSDHKFGGYSDEVAEKVDKYFGVESRCCICSRPISKNEEGCCEKCREPDRTGKGGK